MHKNTIAIIQSELDTIKALLKHMAEQPKPASIELDLALNKMQHLYELMLLLKPSAEMPMSQPDKKPLPESAPSEQPEVSKSVSTSAKKDEPKAEPIPQPTVSAQPPKSEVKSAKPSTEPIEKSSSLFISTQKAPAQSSVLGEKLQTNQRLINESLSNAIQQTDISQWLSSKPLSSIESAIGINDKFLFIRELFNNNSVAFSNTVKKIDSCSDLNEALEYLQTQVSGDFESETAQNFLVLVRRRFITPS